MRRAPPYNSIPLSRPLAYSRPAYTYGQMGYNPNHFFTTMSADSAINALAEGGNVTVMGDYVPPIFEITAARGSITSGRGFVQFSGGAGSNGLSYFVSAVPSQTAQVDILAGQNITDFGVSMTAADLGCEYLGCTVNGALYDADGPSGYDNVATLTSPLNTGGKSSVGYGASSTYRFNGIPSYLVQLNDPNTVHVYAVEGSLTDVSLATSERASVRAGLDIVQPVLNIQNTSSSDVSLVEAGRDITSCPPCTSQNTDTFNIRVGGRARSKSWPAAIF